MKRVSEKKADSPHREELERRILGGLACEWENALWGLAPAERRRMRPPLFRLGDMKDRLGSWSAERREIALSRDLVMNHPWDAVRDILLHEMAHQLRDEVLKGTEEPPHGPQFRRACELLRADPRSSVRYRTLHERLEQDVVETRDRLMLRIQKLMALAESGNRHEAESAMAKAHALILKYNLEDRPRLRDRNFMSVFLGRPALRHSLESYYLANLLHDFYFVRGIWISSFVIEKGRMGRVLEISGLPENVQMAAYVHDCISRYLRAQWSEYRRGRNLSRSGKTDFAIGIIEGFRSKLEEAHVENEASDRSVRSSFALIELKDPLLDRYVRDRYGRLASFRRGGSSVDRNARRDGRRAGKKLVISRAISERLGGSGGLLPCT